MDEDAKKLLREIRDLQREHLESWKDEIKRGNELRAEYEREAEKSEKRNTVFGWLLMIILAAVLVYVALRSDLL